MDAINNFLLSIFTEPNSRRFEPYLSDDGRVYASDGYVAISIPQSELTVPYEGTKPSRTNIQSYFNDFDRDKCESVKVSVSDLAETLAKAQLISDSYQIKCTDCGGSGSVEWEYIDKKGETHLSDSDCPMCDGNGNLDKKPLSPRIHMSNYSSSSEDLSMSISIGAHAYAPFNIYRLFMVAALKGYKEIELFYHPDVYPVFASFGNVKVLLVPKQLC